MLEGHMQVWAVASAQVLGGMWVLSGGLWTLFLVTARVGVPGERRRSMVYGSESVLPLHP